MNDRRTGEEVAKNIEIGIELFGPEQKCPLCKMKLDHSSGICTTCRLEIYHEVAMDNVCSGDSEEKAIDSCLIFEKIADNDYNIKRGLIEEDFAHLVNWGYGWRLKPKDAVPYNEDALKHILLKIGELKGSDPNALPKQEEGFLLKITSCEGCPRNWKPIDEYRRCTEAEWIPEPGMEMTPSKIPRQIVNQHIIQEWCPIKRMWKMRRRSD